MYTVSISDRAMAELAEFREGVGRRLLDAIGRLADWPNHGRDVRKLSGPLEGLRRLRVGNYRALFSVNTKQKLITVTRTGSRQTIY